LHPLGLLKGECLAAIDHGLAVIGNGAAHFGEGRSARRARRRKGVGAAR
jgi:hypothetical protein